MQFDIASQIFDRVNSILNRPTTLYREKLDNYFHVLDFSYSALLASAPDLTKEEYSKLLVEVRKKYKQFDNLQTAMTLLKDRSSVTTSALVEDSAFGTYIIGYSYSTVQGKLANILKSVEHAKVFTDTDEKGNTVTNVGHIPGRESQALKSPLSAKIIDAIRIIPSGQAKFGLLKGLSHLYNKHIFNVSYEFLRPGFDIASFNKILGKQTVLVTLQTKERNAAFATEVETALSRELRKLVQEEGFLGQLINTPGSRSIKQEVIHQVVSKIKGEKPKVQQHKQSVKTKQVIVKTKVPVITYTPKLKIRDPSTGRYASTSNLLALLNFHLHDVVAANMGDGNERRILNYRTGRFATSTRVERVSVAKDGMVTAFYNYMKYPYATFSDGGKQQYPKSRDPKILISKSIRQIAAKMMIQRMRSVLV